MEKQIYTFSDTKREIVLALLPIDAEKLVDVIGNEFEFVNNLADITEKQCLEFIGTKTYGSKPYFCTFDYSRYDKDSKFNGGFCVGHEHQFRISLYSIIEKLGLFKKSKWYNCEISDDFDPKMLKIFIKRN